jgi:N-acetylmuramoyl-L-alanine amidase
MMKRTRKFLLKAIPLIFVFGLILSTNLKAVQAFSEQVIQRGAVGDDVIELQARLQYNGYYHGKIDGVYGWGTYWAVRNFQNNFGLKEVDGLVGPETKKKLIDSTKYYKDFVHRQIRQGKDFTHYGGIPLKIQTAPSKEMKEKWKKQAEARRGQQAKQPKPLQQKKQARNQGRERRPSTQQKAQPTAVNMPSGFSQNDIQLMANAVYGEARGEPYIGQVAVAAVILNRVKSPAFPNTVAGVIFEPGAFTAVSDGQIWLNPNETAKKAVLDAINGWDPTENAMYYFNPDTATSAWIWSRPQIKKIGKHIFCE